MRFSTIVRPRPAQSASVCCALLLTLCADPPPPTPTDPTPELLDDDVRLGEPMDWPFGKPLLRHKMYRDEHEEVTTSLEELRRRRAAGARDQRTTATKIVRSAGLSAAEAKRCLRYAPQISNLPGVVLSARLELLQAALPPRAVVQVLTGAPSLLMLPSLILKPRLSEKLAAISGATGLPAEVAVSKAPTLLLLNETTLHARAEGLQAALPKLDVPSILRRAPRMLCSKAETLRSAFDGLREDFAAMDPNGRLDVDALIQRQPTLLATSRDKIHAKAARLRELCTDEEWDRLVEGSSFGRALTASLEVINRLSTAPRPEDRAPRPVVRILLMTRAEWSQLYPD